jgi:hypothetical protein
MFSIILSLSSCLNVRDQVSHPYKAKQTNELKEDRSHIFNPVNKGDTNNLITFLSSYWQNQGELFMVGLVAALLIIADRLSLSLSLQCLKRKMGKKELLKAYE